AGEAIFAAIVARFCSCTRKAQGCLSVAVCEADPARHMPGYVPGKRGVGRVFSGGERDMGIDYQALFRRASLAATPEACAEFLAEIEQALESMTAPADRARLLMCRARARANQWRTADVCDDARPALRLFEMTGEQEQAADAASLGAAYASRLGELSLASELGGESHPGPGLGHRRVPGGDRQSAGHVLLFISRLRPGRGAV